MLVKQQTRALDPTDRVELIAQKQRPRASSRPPCPAFDQTTGIGEQALDLLESLPAAGLSADGFSGVGCPASCNRIAIEFMDLTAKRTWTRGEHQPMTNGTPASMTNGICSHVR